MDPTGASSSPPLQQTQPITTVATDVDMAFPQTSRESEHPLQVGTDRAFVDQASLSLLFRNMRLPINLGATPNAAQLTPHSWSIRSASSGQISVDQRMKTTLGFNPCLKERPSNSRRETLLQPNSSLQRTKIIRLSDPLDSSETHYHQLNSHLHAA